MEAFVMGYGANLGEVHPYLSTSSNKPTIEEIKMESCWNQQLSWLLGNPESYQILILLNLTAEKQRQPVVRLQCSAMKSCITC